jgi:5-methylcytosine-specific restriction endonuclease McrA
LLIKHCADERKKFLQSAIWKIFRKEIIKRDSSICQVCGTKTKRPKVHHIIQNKELYDVLIPDYFITVCAACHNYISSMIARKCLKKNVKDFITPYYK